MFKISELEEKQKKEQTSEHVEVLKGLPTYVGENAAEHFLDYVTEVADMIYEKYIEVSKTKVLT